MTIVTKRVKDREFFARREIKLGAVSVPVRLRMCRAEERTESGGRAVGIPIAAKLIRLTT